VVSATLKVRLKIDFGQAVTDLKAKNQELETVVSEQLAVLDLEDKPRMRL